MTDQLIVYSIGDLEFDSQSTFPCDISIRERAVNYLFLIYNHCEYTLYEKFYDMLSEPLTENLSNDVYFLGH